MPINERDFALVIGINDYPNYGSKGRPLKGAIGDAEEFANWLGDSTTGGGLKDGHFHLIRSSTNTVDPPQPKKILIDEKMQAIRNKLPSEGGRRFYLYFSGHGQTQTHDDVALCMANWEINRQAAAISFRKYLDYVIRCLSFEEVIVLMDCCRTRKVGAKGQESELTCAIPESGEKKIFVAHATEFQTTAHEAAFDVGNSVDAGGDATDDDDEPIVRGHFTRALMAALKGAAANGSGGVTAIDLASYLEKVVPRIAKRSGHVQKPVFEFRGFVPGSATQPVFGNAAKITTVDTTIRFSSNRTGLIRLEGPTMELIREGPATTGPWEETLSAATHLLTDLETNEEQELRLTEAAGDFDVEF